MLRIKIDESGGKGYYNIFVDALNKHLSASDIDILRNTVGMRMANGKVTVRFDSYGEMHESISAGGKMYRYAIPLYHDYASWWNSYYKVFKYLQSCKELLTAFKIQYKIEGDFNSRFELTNKKGKIYACYL